MDYKSIAVNFEELNNIDIPHNEKIILGVILDGIKYEFLCNFLDNFNLLIRKIIMYPSINHISCLIKALLYIEFINLALTIFKRLIMFKISNGINNIKKFIVFFFIILVCYKYSYLS